MLRKRHGIETGGVAVFETGVHCLYNIVSVSDGIGANRVVRAHDVSRARLLSFVWGKVEMVFIVHHVAHSLWVMMIVYCAIKVSKLRVHCRNSSTTRTTEAIADYDVCWWCSA